MFEVGFGGGGFDSRVFVTEAALLYKQQARKFNQNTSVRPSIQSELQEATRLSSGEGGAAPWTSGPVEPATSWFAVTGHSLS